MKNRNDILEIVFKESKDLIFVFGESGEVMEANPSAKKETGYGERIYGVDISSIFPGVFAKEADKLLFKAESEYAESKKFDTVAYCNNQTCFPVRFNYYQNRQEDTSVIGICLCTNISESKAAQKRQRNAIKEIEEATKIKNEFMANVTHELRTPLNGMKGLAGNLLDMGLDKEQLEIIQIIMRCCDNMTKIINDLLDFSKLEAGKFEIEKNEFNFRKFFNELITFSSNVVAEKGLRFTATMGSGIPECLIGDELRLGQVIHNLISNAIKFTTIGNIFLEVVKTFESETEVELFFMVIDTGIGIAPEHMDKLFQRFSQVDGSITRRFGGTGLGLSICKQLVELMGGTIHVQSEEGKGSTFSFSVRLSSVREAGNYAERKNGLGDNRNETYEQFVFGGAEQGAEKRKSIDEYLEKLLICLEMGTWEKAENFSGIIKRLLSIEKKELKNAAFRVELAVRKADYETSMQRIKELQDALETSN